MGSSSFLEGLRPLQILEELATSTGFSSPLGGERANDCNGSCTSGAVRGQKLTATTILRLYQKLKKRKISKKTIS